MTEEKSLIKEKDRAVEFVPFGADTKLRLTAAMVRQFIAVPSKRGAPPTERDCIRFIMLCRGKKANPFEGDAFLIGYDLPDGSTSFTMVCGVDLFLKRAEQDANYNGYEAGVILLKDGKLLERPGALVLKNEELVGGWCKVYRKDREIPLYKSVNLSTYNTGKSRWSKDPGGQIVKVALSQCLRTAYPTALGGLYTQEEMGHVTTGGGDFMPAALEPITMPKELRPPNVTPAAEDGFQDAAADAPPDSEPEPMPEPASGPAPEAEATSPASTVDGVERIPYMSAKTHETGVRYEVTIDGVTYGTFDEGVADLASKLALSKKPCHFDWESKGQYKNLVTLAEA